MCVCGDWGLEKAAEAEGPRLPPQKKQAGSESYRRRNSGEGTAATPVIPTATSEEDGYCGESKRRRRRDEKGEI